MSLLLAIRKPYIAPNTYLVPSRQTLWPQLADSGSTIHTGDSAAIFGAVQRLPSGNSLTFDNVIIGPGDTVKILCRRWSTGGYGTITLTHDSDPVGSVSTSGTSTNNAVLTVVDSGKAALERGTLNITATGGDLYLQQIQIVAAENRTSTNPDMLPWRIDVPPTHYAASNTTPVVDQLTAYMWGSRHRLTTLNTHYFDYSLGYAPFRPGTWRLDAVAVVGTTYGIATISLDGSPVGTFNTHAASPAYNQKFSVPGLSLNGVETMRISCPTTSSSNHFLFLNWMQFRRTS